MAKPGHLVVTPDMPQVPGTFVCAHPKCVRACVKGRMCRTSGGKALSEGALEEAAVTLIRCVRVTSPASERLHKVRRPVSAAQF